MISRYLLAFSFCIIVFITYHSGRRYVHGNSFGAPFISGRGFTNSPFDGRACNAAGCHTGTLNSGPGTVEISTDIPGEGYRAGTTYNITATIVQNGINKFGFQMTSEDDNHNKAGRFIANAMTRVPSDFYITQGTSPSTSAGNNSKSWSFTWIAPMSPGTGALTFYAAFNGANNNGTPSGDNIYTTSLRVNESIFSGDRELVSRPGISVFPNPALEECTLSGRLKGGSMTGKCQLFSPDGRMVLSREIRLENNLLSATLDLRSLPKSLYLLQFVTENEHYSCRLLIQ